MFDQPRMKQQVLPTCVPVCAKEKMTNFNKPFSPASAGDVTVLRMRSDASQVQRMAGE